MKSNETYADDVTPPASHNAAFSKAASRIRRLSRRSGVAAVEFAIVAPVFFVLVFGMIEFGRMVMVQQILTNASREGARRAVLDAATTDNVTTVVNDYLTSAAINGATVSVTPGPPSSAAFGDPVTVNVSVPFSSVSWMPSPWFLSSTTLSATTVMRREGGI